MRLRFARLRPEMEGSEHSIRYLAATSELAGAIDPGQIDEMARGFAAIRSRGGRLFGPGVGGGAGHASHAVNGVQDGVSAASTPSPPSALNVSTELVYRATVAVVLSANPLVFRDGIFHAKPAVPARDHEAPAFEGNSPVQASVEQPTR
jgi:hypothetical protein